MDAIPALTSAMRSALSGNRPAGSEQDVSAQVCPDGGSAIITSPTNPPPSGDVTSSWEYINCMFTSGTTTYTVNGGGTFVYNQDNGDFSFTYDLTISDGSQTYNITATYECTNNGMSCTYSDTFVDNGKRYRTTNVSVSGNNTSGYNVSATVFIGDLGYVEITATNLTICANGNIGTGTIEVTDANGNVVLSVTFPDCNTMVITYNGVPDTVPQP